MIEQSTELRLGIACDGDALEVVITDSAGAVSSARTLPSSGDFDQDLDLALRDTPASVRAIMLATDRLAAALHGDAKLARVGTLRIGGPVTDGVPVLASWPESLLRRISPVTAIVDGVVDGSGTELVPLDERAAAAYFTSCRGKVDAIAISSVFSPLAPALERRAAEIARSILGDRIPITLGHAVAGFGLLDRESAATLNAALTPRASELLRSIDAAVARHSREAEVFLMQNDGTLSVAEVALTTPILLLEGVAAAGFSGAAALAGVQDGAVTEPRHERTGVMRDGFVVMTSAPTWIGGARMNVELPVGTGATPVLPALPSVATGPGTSGASATARLGAEVSAAYGCALARVGAVTWLVSDGRSDEAKRLLEARQQVIELAILAGADPATIVINDTDSMNLSHARNKRVRIRATGRPMLITRADRIVSEPNLPTSYTE